MVVGRQNEAKAPAGVAAGSQLPEFSAGEPGVPVLKQSLHDVEVGGLGIEHLPVAVMLGAPIGVEKVIAIGAKAKDLLEFRFHHTLSKHLTEANENIKVRWGRALRIELEEFATREKGVVKG